MTDRTKAENQKTDEVIRLRRRVGELEEFEAHLKFAEAVLHRTQKRLYHVLASNPTVIYLLEIHDGAFVPEWVSDNVFQMTGYETQETIDPAWWSGRLHPEDREEALARFASPPPGGHQVIEYRLRHKSGAYLWVRDELRVLYDPAGKPVEAVGVWSNVTEHKQAQERENALVKQLFQAQKMEAIGVLAGGIAHDFNNLLTIIIGFAQLILQEKGLGSQAREYAARIPELGKQAAHQIAQLLTFSRQAPTEQMPIPLLSLVRETIKMLGRTMSENIVIRLVAPESLPQVHADPAQMQQVLMNLCINAGQAMPDGGVMTIGLEHIALDARYCWQYPDARPGPHISLSVKDTGVGMSPEVQEHIFEPFFTTKKPGEGTGLGLATVYGIVKGHRGHITVHSRVGEGSEFRVYLPAMEGEKTAADDAVRENPAGGTETILLAEDSAWLLTVARKMLEELGYTVLSASNGEEALKIYHAHRDRIALVLTDLIMPRIGGQELYEMLRQVNPTVRVLLMSGYGLQETVADMRAKGAKGFVQKPFDLNELGEAVRQALDG